MNPSNHIAIKCSFNLTVPYSDLRQDKGQADRPVWDSASDYEIQMYKEYLNYYLLRIPLPLELLNCNDLMCKEHFHEINDFHDRIIDALVRACNDSIPISRPYKKRNAIPGWNDNVEHYFRVALFWHNLWVQNDHKEDIIAKI